ncbi:MAG TPA: hypothetical protein VED41_07710 [Solirubrobacteraceae bacterium]|nr:hypothetical protein [Solirubrobacteraceae bacterium]
MNDKAIVEDHQDSFDVLVLQANLAVSARNALSSWTAMRKPFWIDPVAYAFAAAPAYLMSEQKLKRGDPETQVTYKRTFKDLAEIYGAPFSLALQQRRSLDPGDFVPEDDRQVVQRMLEWQRTVLSSPPEDAKFFDDGEVAREPVLLTVPYFPLQSSAEGELEPAWLAVNLRLLDAAAATYERNRLAAGLLIEESLFDSQHEFDQVRQTYETVPADHIWLWVSDNEEIDMTIPRAQRLRELVRQLRASGKQVHQAFGGSFSSLLLRDGLTSVGHGVSYWEHKSWEPLAGGGLPTLRYFYPPLGQRLRFLDVDALVDALVSDAEDFHEGVCGCEVCRTTLDGDLANFASYGAVAVRERRDRSGRVVEYDVPQSLALTLSKRHYLCAKAREVTRILADDFDPAVHLSLQIERHERGQQIVDPGHLKVWRAALAESVGAQA